MENSLFYNFPQQNGGIPRKSMSVIPKVRGWNISSDILHCLNIRVTF